MIYDRNRLRKAEFDFINQISLTQTVMVHHDHSDAVDPGHYALLRLAVNQLTRICT